MRKTKVLGMLIAAGIMVPADPQMTAWADHVVTESVDRDISYDQVASDGEKTKRQEVGIEGMEPVYGEDIADGTYEVEVESSSSMFKITKAELTVENGEMSAVVTLSGFGYLKLYMGTGAEAAADDGSSYIDYVVGEDSAYSYEIPVEALDMPIDCAAFSKNKEKWYDRQILFQARSLPKGAVLRELPDYAALKKAAKEKRVAALKKAKRAEESVNAAESSSAEAVTLDLEDGEYAISVELGGGSGRAAVQSPAKLIVSEGQARAKIVWSSSSYDYMLVDGEKYLPMNAGGNSTFEIPVKVMDEPMDVVADTTAMSTPHEVEYTLTFRSGTIADAASPETASENEESDEIVNGITSEAAWQIAGIVAAILMVCALVSYTQKRKKRK